MDINFIKNFIIVLMVVGLFSACGGGGSSEEAEEIEEEVVVPSGPTTLNKLELSMGLLQPEFTPTTLEYNATLSYAASSIRIMPEFGGTGEVTINGVVVTSDAPSDNLLLAEGDNSVEVVVKNGADVTTYSLNLQRQSMEAFTQSAYIKASYTGEDAFGGSVALDGNTLVVGASSEDSASTGVNGDQDNNELTGSGAVYIFVLEEGTWRQQAYIKASTVDAGDAFGTSVDIDGDTIVIGAPREDSDAIGVNGDPNSNLLERSGAAYVFVRDGEQWSEQAYLKASNTSRDDRFGDEVRISGDTVAVGAYKEDSSEEFVNGAIDSGAVYVFTRTGNNWSQQAFIKSSNIHAHDGFGLRFALDGDTLAVSSGQEDGSSAGINGDLNSTDLFGTGTVYVYERDNGEWQKKTHIKASNPGEYDYFGSQVELDGDTLVIVSRGEASNSRGINGNQSNNDAENSGAIYVFVRTTISWQQQAYIKTSNATEGDYLGYGGTRAMALKGDRLLVGAINEKSRSSGVNGIQSGNYINPDKREFGGNGLTYNEGAAYLFERANGSWRQIAYLKASNNHDNMAFGGAIALSDEIMVVGAFSEKSGASGINANQDRFNEFMYAGAVYVFPTNN